MAHDEDLKFPAGLTVCKLCSEDAYCVELFEHMICGSCLGEAENCRRRFAEWHMDND